MSQFCSLLAVRCTCNAHFGLLDQSASYFTRLILFASVLNCGLRSQSCLLSQKLGMGPLNKIVDTLDEVKKKKLMDIVAAVTGTAPAPSKPICCFNVCTSGTMYLEMSDGCLLESRVAWFLWALDESSALVVGNLTRNLFLPAGPAAATSSGYGQISGSAAVS